MASIASLAPVISTSFIVFGQPATVVCSFRKVGQAWFGLKPQRGVHLCKSTHKVTVITSDGPHEFQCPDDKDIHCEAKKNKIFLGGGCLKGNCYGCAGQITNGGEVHQPKAAKLNDEQKDKHWVLTCVAYPRSDVVIDTTKQVPV
ncbi:hypothetical protein SLE2022_162390 [Rubroshorea leprosula]